jgi:hypothetical protein
MAQTLRILTTPRSRSSPAPAPLLRAEIRFAANSSSIDVQHANLCKYVLSGAQPVEIIGKVLRGGV